MRLAEVLCKVMRRSFDLVVSLGTHCYVSHWLKRLDIRRTVGPFDWVFSNIKMNTFCIRDGFKSFLDSSEYMLVDSDLGPRVGHQRFTDEFGLDVIFNHHDPRLDKDHEYFARRVANVNAALKSNQSKLFVCLSNPGKSKTAMVKDLHRALQECTENFHLLVFIVGQPDCSLKKPIVTVREATPSMEIFHLSPTSKMQGGLEHDNPADDQAVIDIIRRFDLPLLIQP